MSKEPDLNTTDLASVYAARRKANLQRWSHGSVDLEDRLARTLGILNYRAG